MTFRRLEGLEARGIAIIGGYDGPWTIESETHQILGSRNESPCGIADRDGEIREVFAIGADRRAVRLKRDARRRSGRFLRVLRPLLAISICDHLELARLVLHIIPAKTKLPGLLLFAAKRATIEEELRFVARRVNMHRRDLPDTLGQVQ